jgi:prepilin-type processing-associated H-X9-DG protein
MTINSRDVFTIMWGFGSNREVTVAWVDGHLVQVQKVNGVWNVR